MNLPRLFSRRSVWIPTRFGCLVLVLAAAVPVVGWGLGGEAWLSRPHRVGSPEVVVVEGWIGIDGVAAAAAEAARHGGVPPVVAAGGWRTGGWHAERANYAELAAAELVRLGFPADKLVVATATDVDIDRSYATATAVRDALQASGIAPSSLNVVTRSVHARRSRLVFARVFGDSVEVGAVGWVPEDEQDGFWWNQSVRAQEFLKETFAYPLELFLAMGQERG